ncbi:MAG TPA: YidC/Oxa1 family membrane protein insertase [Candidatus Paceibacterota bacterium]
MKSIFHDVFYQPLYNGLILFIHTFPWLDAGFAIIFFTLIVKFILFPLSRKATVAGIEMKKIEPELTKIREKYKTDKQEQAKRTWELYKNKKVSPFGSILPILIQLPIIFALYFIFLKSGLPAVDETLKYSFIPLPEKINMNFLGFIDITGKSWILAIAAGVSSFFQMRVSAPPISTDGKRSFQSDLARSMNIQMRYFFPVIVLFISYSISGVVALYWFTSNIFTLVQEKLIRRKFKV